MQVHIYVYLMQNIIHVHAIILYDMSLLIWAHIIIVNDINR